MKLSILVLSILFFVSNTAFAGKKIIADCKVTTVYDGSVFEEGLSSYEYPDFEITENNGNLIIEIGCHQDITTAEGDKIEIIKDQYGKEITVNFSRKPEGNYTPTLFQFTTHETWDYDEDGNEKVGFAGVLLYKEDSPKWTPVASFDCAKKK